MHASITGDQGDCESDCRIVVRVTVNNILLIPLDICA